MPNTEPFTTRLSRFGNVREVRSVIQTLASGHNSSMEDVT